MQDKKAIMIEIRLYLLSLKSFIPNSKIIGITMVKIKTEKKNLFLFNLYFLFGFSCIALSHPHL